MALDRIKAFIDLDGSGFEIGRKKVESSAEKLGENLSHHLKGAIVGAIGIAAIEQAIHRTIELASHISDLSRRLGMTAEKFQELAFAFKTTGGSEEGMVSFLERLSVSREKALSGSMSSPAMLQAFARLGVSQEALKTNTNDQLMGAIGKTVKNGSVQDLIAPLRQVGGKGAGELVAGFRAGLDEKAEEARASGQIIGDSVVSGLKEAEERAIMFKQHLMAELAPAIILAIKKLEDFTDHLRQFGAWLGGFSSKLTIGNFKNAATGALGSTARGVLNGESLNPLSFGSRLVGNLFGVFADAHAAAVDSLFDANEEIMNRRRAEDAKIDELSKPPPQNINIPAINPKPDRFKTVTENAIPVDALQKIGGFVGIGAEMPMINIAKEQLQELRKIAQNTTPQPDTMTGDDSLVDDN